MIKKDTSPKEKPKLPIEFEVIDSVWKNGEFTKYTNYQRSRAYFIFNRRMAIAHPIESALLSKVGINTGQVVNWWRGYLRKIYRNKPQWLWTKTDKPVSTAKKYIPSTETVKIYCKWNDCTPKDVQEALLFFPKDMKEELEEIENIYKKTNES